MLELANGNGTIEGELNSTDDSFVVVSGDEKRYPGGRDANEPGEEIELGIEGQTEWRNSCCCTIRCKPAEMRCCNGFFQVNPIVFFGSVAIIWSFVIYCAADPEAAKEEIGKWQEYIVGTWGWLYIISVAGFAFFMVYLMFSKYGDIVLGKENEPPKFSTATWFSMLFSAGVGIGLFFWGVAEPVCHYAGYCFGGYQDMNRWAHLPRYQRAVQAMNVAWFHWGLAPSACYCVVGLPLAYLSHRKGLPCTMRSIFYPLLGDATFGIIGDIIDIFAVMGTMFGVATSLGLGVLQLSAGLSRLSDNEIQDNFDTQIVAIWIVTVIACVSVMTGLDYGIRRLSEGNFTLGIFVTGLLLFMGNTWFIVSLFIEVAGNHLWTLFDLTFHTDAFQTLESIGTNEGGEAAFMSNWTIFYWGWWISWSPFVGVFIAQISKGRTVREFIIGNMFVPTLMTSIWLTIYGGFGLEMEMKAEHEGIGGNWHVLWPETKDLNSTTVVTYQNNVNSFQSEVPLPYDPARFEYSYNAPICSSNGTEISIKTDDTWRLSCRNQQDMLFDVIDSFKLKKFLSVITLIAIVTYFVTSSDSGSHVIDMLCANGEEDPPIVQRIFWAVSEGAVAHVLLDAGGKDALSALQTASIAAGLPFCVIMIGMVVSTIVMFKQWEVEFPDGAPERLKLNPDGSVDKARVKWHMKLCRAVDYTLRGAICCCLADSGNRRTLGDFCLAWIAPCWIQRRLDQKTQNPGSLITNISSSLFICWIVFEILEVAESGLAMIGWMFYASFACIVAYQRTEFRNFYLLEGDMATDCCQVFFCYPFALLQQLSEAEAIEELQLKENSNKSN